MQVQDRSRRDVWCVCSKSVLSCVKGVKLTWHKDSGTAWLILCDSVMVPGRCTVNARAELIPFAGNVLERPVQEELCGNIGVEGQVVLRLILPCV